MTSAQRRIWFAEQLPDVDATYVVDASLRLRGALDVAALETALRLLADRHPMLRARVSTIEGRMPTQRVVAGPVSMQRRFAQGATAQERRRDGDAILREEHCRPLPLDGRPLFAPVLVTIDPDEYMLALPYHHLIGDGEASRVLRSDLIALYDAVRTGTTPTLPPVGELYQNVVLTENANRARSAAAVPKALERLAGAPTESTVPSDRPRSRRFQPAAHCVRADLDAGLVAAVAAFAPPRRVTPFVVYSAALHLMVQRYAGQSETLLGFMTANRTAAQRRSVGFYSQTVIQRLSCMDDTSVGELLRRLCADILAADDQRHAPLEEIVEALCETRGTDRHPLFQVMINMVDPGPDLACDGLTATPTAAPVPLAWLDLELRLHPRPDGSVEAYLRAPTDLYDYATVAQLARHFTTLVAAIVSAEPEQRASQLPLLGSAERAEVLAAADGPVVECSGTLSAELRAALRRHHSRPAVTFEGDTITYRELNERARALAGRLAAAGVGPGSLVAVCLPRSVDLVVALAGIVLAGAAYLPIDPEEPPARRAFMLADLEPAALLVAGQDDVVAATPTYDVSELSRPGAPELSTAHGPTESDLAYVIYTSGSTGAPKAVGNTQIGIVNRLTWMQDEHQLDADDIVLQKTPYTFDVSVWEFFWPLLTGARLVVARPGGHRNPAYLAELIRTARITTVHFVPSMLRAFIAAGELSADLPLRRVICSGEALPPQVADAFLAESSAQLHNLYGPTEAAIDVTRHRCLPDAGPVMPIGRPVPNTRALVLDVYGNPAPFGGVGELHLGGIQLARGYLNRPDLTAERFIDDPTRPGELLYRTGDLARMRSDGVIEYLGRTDRQIKLRGLRVEPGEVEAALEAVDGVVQAAVDVLGAGGDAALVAFVAADPEALTREALVASLAVRLPAHLLPSRIHLLPALPLSRNGKVDHAALAGLDGKAATLTAPSELPLTPVEEQLLAIVRTVVGRETVSVADSFFAIGGDSIRSIELVARARAASLDVTVEDIFNHPSARQLATVARTSSAVPVTANVAPFSLLDEATRAMLPEGAVDAFPVSTTLAGLLVESTRPARYRVYTTSLRLRGDLDVFRLEQALARILQRHPYLRSAVVSVGLANEPVHVVYGDVPAKVAVIDLRDGTTQQAEVRLRDWLEAEAANPFDWTRPPLLRLTAHRLTDDEFQLTLAEPHLDGFSAALVLSELLDSDQDALDGATVAEVRGYAGYLAEQQEILGRSGPFWRDQLADAPSSHVFGLDAEIDKPVLAHVDVDFPAEVSLALAALNRATGVPLKSLLLAAHVRAVATATGQADVVTGLMANARPATAEGSASVGLFLNANPLRVRVPSGTWWQLVEQVQQLEAATLPHRAYPFAQLRRDRLTGGVGTLFNFTHFHPYDRIARGGRVRVLDRVANDQTYFPLTAQFQLNPLRRSLSLRLEFFGSDLGADGRAAVAEVYRAAVTELARGPHSQHDTMALSVGSDNPDPVADPAGSVEALYATFAAQALRCPDQLAVVGDGDRWTFAELADRAARVAAGLRRHGVAPGEPVGVCLHRGPWLVASVLGVLRAGGVYLPLDPGQPTERRAHMLSAALCRLTIADDRTRHLVPEECVVVNPEAESASDPLPVQPTDPEQPAYLIFTSGSTGTPKGVLVSHRAVANRLAWGRREAPFTAVDVLFARTPIAFVDSVAELLTGPLAGAATHLLPDSVQDPAGLVAHLAEARATRLTSTPTLLAEVLRLGGDLAVRLPHLRHWTVSGEALPTGLVRAAGQRLPEVRFVNLYGSTEVAADATAYVVRGDEDGATVPIGRPIDGAGVRVTDPWGNTVPDMIVGQLVVTGAPVGTGYLDGTPGGFLIPADGGAPTAFRTGDLARIDADGNLEFLGRTDRQIKIRGVRLEPAEIEATLRTVPGVSAAVVTAESSVDGLRCTAYLMLEPGAAAPTPRELRQTLRRRLPAAAIPDNFAALERLPLTATGKVDHQALALQSTPLRSATGSTNPPETLVERELAGLWQAQLGERPIRRSDDFFDVGGHSLHALLLIAAARERLGVELNMTDLFDHPILADQAELIEHRLVEAAAAADLHTVTHTSIPADVRPRAQEANT